MRSDPHLSRREALKQLMQIALLTTAPAYALRVGAEEPHLTGANASAAALGYTEDSGSVNVDKFPQHAPAQRCANCKLFLGANSVGYAPCALYPGNAVNANGWCAGYVAR